MTWAGVFLILIILNIIYEMVIKGEKAQQKKDEEKSRDNRLREEQIQIESNQIQPLNEKSKIRNENSSVGSTNVGLNHYLSKDQLQIGLLAIAVGIIFIILYFKLIHFN
jgi:hypothetical protein